MGDRSPADGGASRLPERGHHADQHRRLTVVGLGPGSLARLPAGHREILLDPTMTVVVRTLHHPAAAELAAIRPVIDCDDLYERGERFDHVYEAISDRVLHEAAVAPTVYAVPGSPMVGEFAVRLLLARVPEADVLAAESFIDAVLRLVGYDPLDRGLRIVNGHELPHPLALDAPTIVGHLDRPEVLADVTASLSRVLPEGSEVTVCANLGADDEKVITLPVDSVPADLAGFRTSLFIDTQPAGLFGLVGISRRLRDECPWDRDQTHRTLVRHLMEEAYELIEAIADLPEDDATTDYVAYDAVEEELGDVLLQVLFHAVIASERGAFDIDDVATRLQEKLVRRHPHVFGDVQVADADEVAANWDRIKRRERAGTVPESVLDGVPDGLPALERAETLQRRAARVGFDWDRTEEIMAVLRQEVDELQAALDGQGDVTAELGDVIFTAVNLLRRRETSGEEALRRTNARFERRFRAMEEVGPLAGLSLDQIEDRWQAAKRRLADDAGSIPPDRIT